jgi:hypothetical protein
MIFVVTALAAYVYSVSGVHHRPPCTLATCGIPQRDHNESPAEPDHDYLEGSLWVQTVTGGSNELSPVPQVSFTTPQVTPLWKPEFVPDFTRGGRVQTRALGRAHRSRSKMRGR